MTDRDVMKMALEALTMAEPYIFDEYYNSEEGSKAEAICRADNETAKAAITALRSALAQPEPEPDMADAYVGAREDLSIWKRRALRAERDLKEAGKTISRFTAAINGPTHMGEPVIAQPEPQVEPVADHGRTTTPVVDQNPQKVSDKTQGEPVAWFEYNADCDLWFLAYSFNPKAKTKPLYTRPQRELSDEELLAAYDRAGKMRAFYCEADLLSAGRAILAARKA